MKKKFIFGGIFGSLVIFFGVMCVMLGSMVSIGSIKEDDTPTISGSGTPPVTGNRSKLRQNL